MSEPLTATLLLQRNARYWRRADLARALKGSKHDRFTYACHRASLAAVRDLAVYGRSTLDIKVASRLALHWYERLNRVALYRAIIAGKAFAKDL